MARRLSSQRRTQLLQAVIPAYLVLCIVLGGASAAGALANAALQLLAIPLLWFALTVREASPLPGQARALLFLLALLVLLLVLQLVPLPPQIWAALPGRERIAEGYRLLGIGLPYQPLSLVPERTLGALLWLLPAIGVLFGMFRLGAFNARLIAWALGATACASVLLGAMQLAGGTGSPAYIYERTNYGVATGFFANANHFGTLMLMTVPLLAAMLGASMIKAANRKRTSAIAVVTSSMILLLFVGIVITRSLAAIGLLLPIAAGSFCVVRWRQRRMPIWIIPMIVVLMGAVLATVAVEPFDNDLTTSSARTTQLSRYNKYVTTISAIGDYFPAGAGFGTMPTVYHLYEDPAKVTRTFASHTHSDPLEILLDAGLPGALLMLLFAAWWGWRVVVIWRAEEPNGFARAATIATGAAIAHSFVDYPLRTAADAAVFAAMLALMAGAQERTVASRREASRSVRHLSA